MCGMLLLTGCGLTAGSGSDGNSAWARQEEAGERETKKHTRETKAPETETVVPETETSAPETETTAPETETAAPETETEDPMEAAVRELLSQAPTMVFSSGAGAWATELTFEPDNPNYAGYFRGNYHDSNMGESGEGYDSTVYVCSFTGYFYDFEQVSDYVWTMHRGRFETEDIVGEEWIEEQDNWKVRYVATEPYGLEEGDLFYLYLPGASTEGMDEDFLMWMQMPNGYEALGETIDFWAMYNVDAGYGFYGGEW